MRNRPPFGARPWVVAALLLGSVGAAQARVGVSVGVNFGFPYVGARYYSPGYYGGYHGWRGYAPYRYGYGYRPWGAGVVLAAPLVYGYGYSPEPWVIERPVIERPVVQAPRSVPPSKPDPIIYPRHGQDGQQTEYDRQECNRWATTQPQAVADASVFQRAVEACMDGRGYSMR